MSTLVPDAVYVDTSAQKMRHDICEYLERMSKELSDIAYKNKLDTLAIIFEMARKDARRILITSDAHIDHS